ncbi:MAG: amino acid adenylation domain-containing protein, partial [bacterium]|nr:amino acid adenylation domain-containing protein [bacterium]
RLSGTWDVLVGTPIAGRTREEIEGLIGFFLNTLVLRVDLSDKPTFCELLERERELNLGAFSHQDVPFEKILEAIQPERDLARTPLFQVFFNMVDFPQQRLELSGLTLEILTSLEPASKFDLTIYASDQAGAITMTWVYNVDLFDPARIEEIQAQYTSLLQQVADDPERPIDQLSLVTAAARERLPDPRERLSNTWPGAVHQLFAHRADADPERTAAVDPKTTRSYGELDHSSNRLAHRLVRGGLEKGEVVAIYAHRSAVLVEAILGVFKAGGAFLILDPLYPAARQIRCLEQAAPRALLHLTPAGSLPAELAAWLEAHPACGYLGLPAAELDGVPDRDPAIPVGADDIAYIAFTSGSTGEPKGIVGLHRSLTHFTPWQRETFDLGRDDSYSVLSGLSHDPLHRDLFLPLQLGAVLCFPDPDHLSAPSSLVEWMRRQGITIAHLTPAMAHLLVQGTPEQPEARLDALRYAFFVGAVLTVSDVARLRELAPGVRCVNYYGTTETQQALGYYLVPETAGEGPQDWETLPLGRGMKDVQLLVLNQAGELAGIGELGEIHVCSPHLARGYLGDAELTGARFFVNPLTRAADDRVYRTGDLGRYRPDGNVEFAGRADFQVNIRGFRIELGEIEAALLAHEAVKECVVLAREEGPESRSPGDPRLVAYLVAAGGAQVPTRELLSLLRARLPDYMVPAAFVALDQMPLTPSGKIDRRALPAPDRDSSLAGQTEYFPPRTATEQLLAGIWCEVLGAAGSTRRVGIHDNFFHLGGHSLLATQVVSRLRQAFAIELPLRELFGNPTVAGLAARIEAAGKEPQAMATPPIVPAPRDRDLPLSLSQDRLWFLDRLQPGTATYNLPASLRLRGRLRPGVLMAALNEVIRVHESLRTTFSEVAGQAVQIIAPFTARAWPVVDLGRLPATAGERELARLRAEEAAAPFDLTTGPLLRARLIRLTAEEWALLLTMHHIVTDGWSMLVLARQLAAVYEAVAAGVPSPGLPELPIQYADYAVWQRQLLVGEEPERSLAWWCRQLADPPILDLPADRPRPAVQTFRGVSRPMTLSSELSDELRQLGREHGATPFMTLLAAFRILLARLSGTWDVLVGTPIAGRTREEIEGLIGFFLNTLVLRVDLS